MGGPVPCEWPQPSGLSCWLLDVDDRSGPGGTERQAPRTVGCWRRQSLSTADLAGSGQFAGECHIDIYVTQE